MPRSTAQTLLPSPASAGGRRAGTDRRRGRKTGPVREALYVYMDATPNLPNAPAEFVTQHLDQEWTRRRGYADHGRASRAYQLRPELAGRDRDKVALSL